MTSKVVYEPSIESYGHFTLFRNLQIFKGRHIWGKQRKNSYEYKFWAKEYHQTYPTQNPFSPFGVQRKHLHQLVREAPELEQQLR